MSNGMMTHWSFLLTDLKMNVNWKNTEEIHLRQIHLQRQQTLQVIGSSLFQATQVDLRIMD